MTEKRYFERKWEEEYYIFDSHTISEKEFDEKVQYEDYQAFTDSMMGDEIVDLLNELTEENMMLKGKNAHYKLLLMSLEETAKKFCEVRRWNE